ncbi:MAG: PHP domain-containing protein [Limnochordia bacterium]
MSLFYDVFPKIVPVNRPVEINIRGLFEHSRFDQDAEYEVSLFPAEGFVTPAGDQRATHLQPRVQGDVLRVPVCCENEQEHVIWIERVSGETRSPVGEFRIYALDEDLFSRYPFKGDFHIHSDRSDGRESPGYVAGAARRTGLDFMAVTDHHRYRPSLEAAQAFAGTQIDLRIFPGEEVHPPKTKVHIVNFGGRFSVNELFSGEAFQAEVAALADSFIDIPQVYRYQYAACVWSFEQIRAGGGLGVFCHPYWFTGHRYDVPEALTTLLFERKPFDAYEVIGGFYRHQVESNILQVSRYHEERARGREIPIVGASDAHGCERGELFGWYYTIVFSPSTDLPDLIANIKGLYSVAVEALPESSSRAHGPFRLVKYAQFLLREVLPKHDELCADEGRLMLAYLADDQEAAERLLACKGRVKDYYKQIWAQV